jgi:hypothetical protein
MSVVVGTFYDDTQLTHTVMISNYNNVGTLHSVSFSVILSSLLIS